MGIVGRHPVVTAFAALLAIVVVVLGTTAWAVWSAAHTDDARLVDRADAILVLGAAQYQGDPSPVFEGRLEHARLLYEQGRAERVVVLGAGRPGDTSTEAEAGRAYLLEQGLPATAVVAIPVGATTLESMEAAAAWMRERDLRTAFLVSDPWHNLRIRRMASDLGIQGYVSATWHSAARSEQTRLEGYVREVFAYLYYRIVGE
ncbi:MAG TPA: YdcF family protein [Actinomycetota bacterium]|nr:YdcF family protein [Actinomycetota bacterium]